MLGFDEEFLDTADFSRKITGRIWHDRGIDLIRKHYADKVLVRHPLSGITTTCSDVIKGSLGVMYEFPDRRIYDEDFIWSEESPGVFYNSHRLFSTMTHLGHGMFGPATGTKIKAYTLADIMYRENQAFNEYLIRDHAGIASQIGLDPEELATSMAITHHEAGRKPATSDELVQMWTDGSEMKAPIPELAERYADTLKRIWEDASIRLIKESYHDESVSVVPGPDMLNGREAQERFVVGYLASMPHAKFRLHHWVERVDPGMPVRVALRWTLEGQHDGFGKFGKPTGAPLVVMAISHAEFWNGRIMREWHGIDELSLWKQIADHRLARQ